MPKVSSAKRERLQGRPGRHGASVGPDAILHHTRVLLRVNEPAKLSLREIARSLNIDPGLIRYYFGDKAGLFTAVVQQILQENRRRQEEVLQSDLAPAEKIRRRVHVYLDVIFQDPYQHQLIVELVLYGRRGSAAQFRRQMVERAYPELERIVEEAGANIHGKRADARFLHVAILGACEYFITGRPLVKELFSDEQYSGDLIKRYGDFLGDLIVSGLGLDAGNKGRRIPRNTRQGVRAKERASLRRRMASPSDDGGETSEVDETKG